MATKAKTPKTPQAISLSDVEAAAQLLVEQVQNVKADLQATAEKLGNVVSARKGEVNAWIKTVETLSSVEIEILKNALDFSVFGAESYEQAVKLVNAMTDQAKRQLDEAEAEREINPKAKLWTALKQAEADKAKAAKAAHAERVEAAKGSLDAHNLALASEAKEDGRWGTWFEHGQSKMNSARSKAREGLKEGEKSKASAVHAALLGILKGYLVSQGFRNEVLVDGKTVASPEFAKILDEIGWLVDPKPVYAKTQGQGKPAGGRVETHPKPRGRGPAQTESPKHTARKALGGFVEGKGDKPQSATPEEVVEYMATMGGDDETPTAMEAAIREAVDAAANAA